MQEHQNTTDTHAPDRPEVKRLSPKEKEQLEAGAEAERHQGPKRNEVPGQKKS